MTAKVLDLEWDGNDPDKRLLVLGWDRISYPWNAIPLEVLEEIENPEIGKVVFTKADHHWLLEHGFKIAGDIFDVQVMCWCYDETTELSLDWCAKHYLREDPDKRLVRKQGKVYFTCDDGAVVLIGDAPMEELLAYNGRDLAVTSKLCTEMGLRLTRAGIWQYYERHHMPFSPVLLDMEMNGLPLDLDALEDTRYATQKLADSQEDRLKETAEVPDEFNLNSRDQIANLLFTGEFELPARIRLDKEDMAWLKAGKGWPEALPTTFDIRKLGREYVHGAYELKGFGLKPKVKAPKCAARECSHEPGMCLPSVSSKTLKVHHGDLPWVVDLCEYRVNNKALQFMDSWQAEQKDGRLHTHFKQTGTATGRLSSSDPVNLQNIPARGELGKRIRNLFAASEGYVFVNGDFSQIEARLMAHFSEDPVLMGIFIDGLDVYEETTVALLGDRYGKGTPERELVKMCFLAMGYGAQPPKIRTGLAENGYRFPLRKVEAAYNDLMNLYEVFWRWKERYVLECEQVGYSTTIAGHRRHLNFGDRGQRWKTERQCVNSRIQGSAADITQDTMVAAHAAFPHWKLILQVHDEIMFEVKDNDWAGLLVDCREFKKIAETRYELVVPTVFDPKVARTWGETK